jgi:hypothetical protein
LGFLYLLWKTLEKPEAESPMLNPPSCGGLVSEEKLIGYSQIHWYVFACLITK